MLQQSGHYKNSKWVGLLAEGDSISEGRMYDPLVKLLEVINQKAREIHGGAHEGRLKGKWVHLHAPASKSNYANPKTHKPGIVFMPPTNATTVVSLPADKGNQPQGGEQIGLVRSQGISTPHPCLADEHAEPKNGNAGHNTMSSPMEEGQLGGKGPTIWWLHVFTVLEVASKKRASSLARLAFYISQIFMEQLDRMFVFALTLELDQLCAHLFDRSGIVSTCPIDIHKSPMDSLHVIASFTWSTPQKLGWDSTFRVWDGEKAVPSYRLALESLGDYSSACHLPWVIDGFPLSGASAHASASSGPSHARGVDSSSNHQSSVAEYVTIRNLNLRRVSRLWGSATMVFEVILLDDWVKKNTKAQIYVLKQSWQRLPALESDVEVALSNSSQRTQESGEWSEHLDFLRKDLETWPYEACILRRAGLDSSRLQEAGYVMSEGRKVETLGFIRKGLTLNPVQSKSKNWPDSGSITSLTLSSSTNSQAEEEYISRSSGVAEKPLQLVSRTLTRMVLKLPGPTIKFFGNKLELLNGLLGALNDHEELYRNGIIHRGVSINNIILSASDSPGRLIDFDHSKITVQMVPFLLPEGTTGVRQADKDKFHEDVVRCALTAYEGQRLSVYLTAAAASRGILDTEKITLEDLGWSDANGEPNFYPIPPIDEQKAGIGRITGTLTFMSHKLEKDVWLAHNAIHDVESLCWVLVYIAITLGRPGIDSEKTDEQREAIHAYFDDPTLSGRHKRHLFDNPEELEVLLTNVDDYFDDLKPLIRQWFEILLRLAWGWGWGRGIEFYYPHRAIRKLLKKAIADLDEEAGAGAESLKSKYTQEIMNAISRQRTVHMLTSEQTPATTPTQPAPARPAPTQPAPTPFLSNFPKSRVRSPPTSPPANKKFKQN